ncbi:MAG: hypothetical protein PHS54_02030 [Clostridia bacterium]|nr:hypothetical protein [Clostridia bacterium]
MIVNRKIFIFLGVVLLLSFCMLYSNQRGIFDCLNIKTLTVYAKQPIDSFDSNLSGNGYKFDCSIQDYENLKNKRNIQGISFETSLKPQEIINRLKLKIQSTQKLLRENETIIIYYCYVENVGNSIILSNKKVNLQIAFNGQSSIVGMPLILGSY